MRLLSYLLLLFCAHLDQIGSQSAVARYDHYRLCVVQLATDEHVKLFQALEAESDSFQFIGHPRNPNQNILLLVAAHRVADLEDLLSTHKLKSRILAENFQQKIDDNFQTVLPKDTDPSKYDWQHYFHLETINAWIDAKVKEFPKIVTKIDMGESFEGEPVMGLKISHNPQNKAIFIESGIHAREWIAPATATYIINELLTSKDERVKRLATHFNWIIFPVVNPDGYKYTFTHDRMWRKNRSPFGICRGVDLNRNFPFHWNTTGTSGNPCAYDYSGPAAASEKETQNIMKFLEERRESEEIRTFLSLHSYSQLLMFPYGHTAEKVENYDDLTAIGKKAVERIKEVSGQIYKSGSLHETIYPSSGGSKDWAHATLNISVTFSFELRGPPDSEHSFLLPADQIKGTAEEAFAAVVTIVEEAEKLGYYE